MSPQEETSDLTCPKDDSDDDESSQHYHFDAIDAEAVDFQPFITTPKGIALNYHTSDHPEHKLLRKASMDDSMVPSNASSFESVDSFWQSPPRRERHCVWSLEREGKTIPRRYITFMGIVAFTGLIALYHIRNVTLFFNKSGDALVTGEAVQKKHYSDNNASTSIPRELQDAYRDVSNIPVASSDTPVYWNIPSAHRSETSDTTTSILVECLGLDLQHASTNAETTKTATNQHITANGATSQDILVVDDFWQTASRFNATTHGGRLFCVFSDPIDRLLSEFKSHHQRVNSNKESPITLKQYISDASDNSLVRGLVHVKDDGPLTKEHLNAAKKIVETKFLVGLEEDPEVSLQRFESYFQRKRKCTNKTIDKKKLRSKQGANHPGDDKSKKEHYQMVAKANQLDAELFHFIQATFQQQAAVLST